ncbi:MAG: hypothetical protein U1G07_10385 [Verrucomicrobiota bacterium]
MVNRPAGGGKEMLRLDEGVGPGAVQSRFEANPVKTRWKPDGDRVWIGSATGNDRVWIESSPAGARLE